MTRTLFALALTCLAALPAQALERFTFDSIDGGQIDSADWAGKPVLVVLDEPNSNLDDSGEKALAATLERLKAEQITLLVISHRHHLLAHVDKLLVLKDGRMGMFGPRDEVIGHFKRQRQPVPEAAPTRVQASAMHAHPTARGSQS